MPLSTTYVSSHTQVVWSIAGWVFLTVCPILGGGPIIAKVPAPYRDTHIEGRIVRFPCNEPGEETSVVGIIYELEVGPKVDEGRVDVRKPGHNNVFGLKHIALALQRVEEFIVADSTLQLERVRVDHAPAGTSGSEGLANGTYVGIYPTRSTAVRRCRLTKQARSPLHSSFSGSHRRRSRLSSLKSPID